MDLLSKVSSQPGATPIEGLPDAWHWSRMIFNFDTILSQDGEHVLEMRVMGRYDEDLARAVLRFARDHSAQITGSDRPLVALEGFSHPGWEFDTVASVSPDVHENHAQDDPELHKATFTLFPGYRSEFSGKESKEEAIYMFRRSLQPTKLDRAPVPFLKMRYDNTRTKSYSTGPDRGLAPLAVLLQELTLLDGAPGSHVEWENRLGEIWKAEFGATLTLATATSHREITTEELLPFAEQTITRAGVAT